MYKNRIMQLINEQRDVLNRAKDIYDKGSQELAIIYKKFYDIFVKKEQASMTNFDIVKLFSIMRVYCEDTPDIAQLFDPKIVRDINDLSSKDIKKVIDTLEQGKKQNRGIKPVVI